MKKIIYTIALLVIFCSTLVSCKKFLEKQPIGKTGKETLFETVDGAKMATLGAYNLMLTYYKNNFGMYGDVASDNLVAASRTSVLLAQFNFQSNVTDDALAVGTIWLNIYETINNANNILAAVPALKTKFPNQTATLDSIYGQALVIRALGHFDLSRVYAQPYNFTTDASHNGVPVLTKTPAPGEFIARKTMKETYDQVIQDLTDALPFLQKYANHNTQTGITYQAALALLSRVYLYKGDWAQCINYSDRIINDSAYKLADATGYKASFNTYFGNTSQKTEGIFQLTNNGFNVSTSSLFSIFSDFTAAQYAASVKIKTLFDSDDIRFTTMFTNPTTGDNAGKTFTKKYGDGSVTTLTPQLIQVVRLSEVYLNRAEAKWNLQKYAEAAEDIRIISQRAHPNRTITINYVSNDDLYKQIANERNRELCFEGHRFFDLARRKENLLRGTDCNATTCSLNYPNNKFVLPIPSKEVEANKAMVQNPGY
ncbi:RagB/SusD family nutrient uptake outer membrane protein [Pedobacter nototheniae]|uniref:RagB/SusD family nutrient uptake outer membrane protein n=1 Tax=Pedobacter nototheniae TaxID=2488994 RepID=UPI00292DBEF6|nr:RagB/SusD family nutrient uptake outer membrane protein [Pedobacter nototheniae]